ncbi:hypothetical protein [Cryobacterium psychrophilum]|uniref:Glycerophosphoryl diester phosphodiesterase membrane domain-containing protein n=1 Tax=Cryobacterium psychrophilum TaxID=41988 RepID=A0A4Y8KQP2_9MICO|nr:hypothetical protein [Cryobacterium psychrophilum]TDW30740.1 membrane-anchored glycerophosphoryl diester phosphodiesterase (GDPDase) [Cryobacterium psychrophilum]TFD75854.1 hypothetical protein E3T53_15445 [Cryobacterium psychrophilum]
MGVVTDPQNWQPPTFGAPPQTPPHGPPIGAPLGGTTGGPIPPPVGAPPVGAPPVGAPLGGPPPGWTPPPKPGLIPLRPLGFGALLFAPLRVLRRNPRATFGSALIIQGIVLLATIAVVGPVTYWVTDRISTAPTDQQGEIESGGALLILLSALVPLFLSVIAAALLQGVIVTEVARATLGEKLRLGRLWRAARPRLWTLVLWTLLLLTALIIGLGILVLAVALLALLGDTRGLILAILTGVIGGLAILAVTLWIATKTAVVPSLIVLERLTVRAAIRRSWSLTRGYFWRTFGVLALVTIAVNLLVQLVTTPFAIVFSILMSLVDPTASVDAYVPAFISYAGVIFVTVVAGAIGSVITSATNALIYLDLRMRKEGLDLELARYVEGTQTGAVIPDPYLITPTSPQA